jgi:hypothetical protein
VYETEHFNGVGELLEILGSIINGFALPLKATVFPMASNQLKILYRAAFRFRDILVWIRIRGSMPLTN